MRKPQRLGYLLLALLFAAPVFAQTAATADLRGSVKDPNGGVIVGATVSLRDVARNLERTVKTNGDGEYVLLSIPPGRYSLTITAEGFAKMVATDISLTVGQVAEYPVTMRLATAQAEVTVTGEPLLIETAKTSNGTTVGEQRIEN